MNYCHPACIATSADVRGSPTSSHAVHMSLTPRSYTYTRCEWEAYTLFSKWRRTCRVDLPCTSSSYIVIRITIHARTVSAKCIVPTRLRRRGGPSRGTAAAHDPTLSPSALFEGPAARTWAGKFVHFEQFFRRACTCVYVPNTAHMLAGRDGVRRVPRRISDQKEDGRPAVQRPLRALFLARNALSRVQLASVTHARLGRTVRAVCTRVGCGGHTI